MRRLTEACAILLRDMPHGPARDRYGDALLSMGRKTWTGTNVIVVAGRNERKIRDAMRIARSAP